MANELELFVRPGLAVPGNAMRWRAVSSGGPGGQHVNKTASKIELYLDFGFFCDYPDWALAQLRAKPQLRWNQQGELMLVESGERSQHRNLKRAKERLAQLLREGLVRPKFRRATRPTRGSIRRRLTAKRQRGETKQGRKKIYSSDS